MGHSARAGCFIFCEFVGLEWGENAEWNMDEVWFAFFWRFENSINKVSKKFFGGLY